MSTSNFAIHEKLLIPDLLRLAPQSRSVLDRYGLRGCGGPLGPVETLGFFAKAHAVPLGKLMQEIRDGLAAPLQVAPATPSDTRGDVIYRRFFKSGIGVVLTLGALWGAYLLLRIAATGSFTAAGIHEVNAHGHAQIFGWVGLFVMGFAYQAFPRFKHTSLQHVGVAIASFWIMLLGIVTRSIAEPLAGSVPILGPIAVTASALEVIAIGLFVFVICQTLRQSGKALEFYDFYVLSSLVWFAIQAVYETIYLAATLARPDETLALVSTWQGALRDIQIHGFALLMILGVSQRLFHHFYGFPAPNRRVSHIVLACINAAVLGEAVGLILMRVLGHAWAALWYGSVLLLAGSVTTLVLGWRIFSSPEESDRSLKFMRTAYVWLLASLGMLMLTPVYQFAVLPMLSPQSVAAQIGFSHAYYGAVRHAITVGFVSLMIVGVAAKVVPTLNGVDVRRLTPLWLPFILINTGCGLRVTMQTLTDFTPTSFPVAGISGVLEVIGLAVWGVHLWSIMAGRVSGQLKQNYPSKEGAADSIGPESYVGEVLERHPELLDVFLNSGFKPLANPVLRNTVARTVTIKRACRLMNVDVDSFLEALGARLPAKHARRFELPVLSGSCEEAGMS